MEYISDALGEHFKLMLIGPLHRHQDISFNYPIGQLRVFSLPPRRHHAPSVCMFHIFKLSTVQYVMLCY